MDTNNNPIPSAGPAPSVPSAPVTAPVPQVSPVSPAASESTSAQTMAPVNPPVTPPSDNIGAPQVAENVSAPVPPAEPIARPTNIDGINPIAAPVRPVADSTSSALNSLVEQGSVAHAPISMPTAAPVENDMPATNPFASSSTTQTPSVSFTDPAMQPDATIGTQPAGPEKKKSNKKVLIALSVIAFLVAAALAAVLVMELMGVGLFA